MKTNRVTLLVISMLIIVSLSCGLSGQAVQQNANAQPTGTKNAQSDSVATSTTTATQAAPTPTATATSIADTNVGPNPQNIPANYNPLDGEPVADPSLLQFPAVLVSITDFPPSARPQAGLSFSPWVFEMYIAEGMTRFLATFYGDYPQQEPQFNSSCDVRQGPFDQTGTFLGNRVWWDVNANGLQDVDEPGVGGVCVDLVDAATGNTLATTSTDSNGFYGFNVTAGTSYRIHFVLPDGLAFTQANAGDDHLDSDADPATGLTPKRVVQVDDNSVDAGLTVPDGQLQTVEATPAGAANSNANVGPVRSGRLPYVYIRDAFQNSCLVYASATYQIRDKLRGCAMVFGNDSSNINSAMLDVTRLEKIAQENKRPDDNFNYSGNLFSDQAPAGGSPAATLQIFYSYLNQSEWQYDPASGEYLRYEDKADGSGKFYPANDRLTGRQLAFSNVIVMIAQHTVISPYIIDINLNEGEKGTAYAFRDGQMYTVEWTTVAGTYEQTTGKRRPIRFVDVNGNPFALKPGSTWVHIMTTASYVQEKSPGFWWARFLAPAGAAQ